jgi:FkbM family methyltransferase
MKFYGQWTYQVDRYLYDKFFKDKKEPGFFIEAGANDGETCSCCKFFEESLNWKGLNVEANPYLKEVLEQKRPTAINENIALSSPEMSGKPVTFSIYYHPRHGSNHGINFINDGSLNKDVNVQKKYVEHEMKFKFEKEVSVQCITYRELLLKHGIDKVDLFCLDVEGCELEVMKGMQGAPIPEVFCVEYPFIGEQPLKEACEPLGLKYHSTQDNNMYFTKKE